MRLILENRSVNHTRFGFDFQWLDENRPSGGGNEKPETGNPERQQTGALQGRLIIRISVILNLYQVGVPQRKFAASLVSPLPL